MEANGESLTALSPPEQARLAELEARIAVGLSAFLNVGEALWSIKTEGLFRASHGSFEAYCQEKWGFHAHHAARLLRSLDVAHLIEGNGESLPENLPETALRPLAPLEPSLQLAVWHLADKISGHCPSSGVISSLVRAVQQAIGAGMNAGNEVEREGGREREKGIPRRNGDPCKPPRFSTSGQTNFFANVHQLASSRAGYSVYLIVGQIDEDVAKSHLEACQRAIVACHEAVEQIRGRFPWI